MRSGRREESRGAGQGGERRAVGGEGVRGKLDYVT